MAVAPSPKARAQVMAALCPASASYLPQDDAACPKGLDRAEQANLFFCAASRAARKTRPMHDAGSGVAPPAKLVCAESMPKCFLKIGMPARMRLVRLPFTVSATT